jgi:hypothetical protein
MTTEQKIARRKLRLLELASDLGNVSKACKMIGYSRQQFYEIRRNFQTYGADGLIDRLPGPRNPHPNRVPTPLSRRSWSMPWRIPATARCASLRSWCCAASRSPPATSVACGSATFADQA